MAVDDAGTIAQPCEQHRRLGGQVDVERRPGEQAEVADQRRVVRVVTAHDGGALDESLVEHDEHVVRGGVGERTELQAVRDPARRVERPERVRPDGRCGRRTGCGGHVPTDR